MKLNFLIKKNISDNDIKKAKVHMNMSDRQIKALQESQYF